MKILKEKIIPILISLVVLLFVLYLACPTIRDYVSGQNIDPSFVASFSAIIIGLLSLLEGSRNRKLTYNMDLLNHIRNNGLSLISKLIGIRQKSELIYKSLKDHQQAIRTRQIFIDSNDTVSTKDINEGFEVIAAYADTYFREECVGWNEMLEKLSAMATDNLNVVLNYKANLEHIINGQTFRNHALDRIDEIVINAEKTNDEMEQITVEMRNKIIQTTNNTSNKIKRNL